MNESMNNETELNATEVLRMSFELKKALEMIANDLNIDVLIKISSDLNKSNIIVSNEIRSLEEFLDKHKESDWI